MELRLGGLPAVNAVLLYPVAGGLSVSVKLYAAHDPVVLVLWHALAQGQFVHFQGLQLKRQQAVLGVALQKQNTAVHLFPLHGHPQHLVQALLAGHVAVAAFRPLAPQRLDLAVQFVALSAGLQGEAFSHHVPAERQNDFVGQVAVSLQVAGAGADRITGHPVGQVGAFVVGLPVCVQSAVVGGVISGAAQLLQLQSPGFALTGCLWRKPAD